MHDGSDRPIVRPTDPAEQTCHYSGKKKRHTVKNVLLTHGLRILFLSDTYEGSVHDKAIADTTPYPLPPDATLLQDAGFQGFGLPDVTILQPTKRPRGGTLSSAQQTTNHTIARQRIPIEHVLSSVKRCRIVKDTIRLWHDELRDRVMAICCGLHNLRLRLTPETWTTLHKSG